MATTPVNGGQHPSDVINALPATGNTVRLLLRLKAQLTWRELTRSPWLIVGTALGGVWALVMVGFYGGAMVSAPTFLDAQGVRTTAVLVASTFTLVWWLASLVSGRADATLHAGYFAMFPVSSAAIAWGQLLGALVGFFGPLTIVLLVLHASMWRLDVVAWVTAVLLVPVGWMLMVLGNRCFTAVAEGLLARRRVGEVMTLILLALLILIGPVFVALFFVIMSLGASLHSIADVLAWTPLGALWAIPADLSHSAYAIAAARAGIVAMTASVLTWLWLRCLVASWESGPQRFMGAGGRQRGQGAGLFDRLPAQPWAAVAARSLIYWVKDPRYSASLVSVLFLCALSFVSFGGFGPVSFFAAPFVAFLMAYTISGDVSYDHKGFALHLLTGIKGSADRLGRVVGMLLPGVPLTVLATVAVVVATGRPELLPGVIGTSVVALLGGAGVSSVVSARYTYPAPLPGRSPFQTPQGFTVLNVLLQFVVFLMIALLALPAGIPYAMHMATGQEVWGWVSFGVGTVLGPGFCAGGIWLGGRWVDARGPELLEAVSEYR